MHTKYPLKNVRQIKRSYRQLFSQVKCCDALVIGPGGLFPFSNSAKLVIIYLAVLHWKAWHKKVMFLGIGVSVRMGSLDKFLWKQILRKSDLFYTRSNGFLSAVGVAENERVQTASDIAFASKAISETSLLLTATHRVGIVPANLGTENTNSYEKQVKTWGRLCEVLLNAGYQIDLIAFTKGKDDMLIRDIFSYLQNSDSRGIGVQQIPYTEVAIAINRWREYEQVICMRFHSLVLSILASVPALPIAYGQKTAALAAACGLEEYLLYWNMAQKKYFGEEIDLDEQTIAERFHKLNKHRNDIITRMELEKKRFIASAEKTISCVMENIR